MYEIELTRGWVKKAAHVLKVLSGTLSLALPIAAPAAKLSIDAATYQAIEDQLKFGKECAGSFLRASDNVGDWLSSGADSDLNVGRVQLSEGAHLRELHALLKQVDSGNAFGGLGVCPRIEGMLPLPVECNCPSGAMRLVGGSC